MTGCTAPFSETEEDINRGLVWIRFKEDGVGGGGVHTDFLRGCGEITLCETGELGITPDPS